MMLKFIAGNQFVHLPNSARQSSSIKSKFFVRASKINIFSRAIPHTMKSSLLNTYQVYAVTNILYNINHYLVEFIENMIQYKLDI